MDNIVVTIARHFGSGGKTIGEMLANDLGINWYERDIIKMASEASGISELLFNQADEKLSRTPLFFGKAKAGILPSSSNNIFSLLISNPLGTV